MLGDLDPWNFYLPEMREAFSKLLANKHCGPKDFAEAFAHIGAVLSKYVKNNAGLLAGNPDFNEVGLRDFRNRYSDWDLRFRSLAATKEEQIEPAAFPLAGERFSGSDS
ncbi:MAG: hypothetical protein K1X83_07835 [Oligoflexia bacterium]|nr:hypothetical protein [Oligoflexia bacterium]